MFGLNRIRLTTQNFIFTLSGLAFLQTANAAAPVDTVNLSGIQVVADRHLLFHEGTLSFHFDSMMVARFAGLSLGDMISQSLPFPVMSYGGTGSLSGITMRGTSSAQTTIAWNGFPINSLTAGNADLSLVHPSVTDDISINAGIPGSVYGYGNIGGVIFLSTHPEFDNRLNINAQYSVGSFNTSRQSFSARAGNDHLQMHFNYLRQHAENDFLYTDNYKTGDPLTRQSHNRMIHTAFYQNTFLQLSHNQQIELGIWYQVRNKKIPALMGSYEPGTAEQKDSITRWYAGYTRKFNRAVLRVKTAYFDEYLRYTDRQDPSDNEYTLDSRIRSRQWLSSAEYRHYLNDHLIADAGLTGSMSSAHVKSYGREIRENRIGLFAGARLSYPVWTANLTILKEWVNFYDPPVQFALNGQVNLVPGRISLRAKLANHYRIPAMNDKYWQPGGNLNLKPEHGGGGDIGLSLVLPMEGKRINRIETDITAFSFMVNDWIQWVPGITFWHADNYQRVWARGLESRLAIHVSIQRFTWEAEACYFYTRSQPLSTGGKKNLQLPYVPVHTGAVTITACYRSLTLAWYHSYNSKKYSTSDNTDSFAVPACYLSNLYAGWKYQKGSFRPELSVQLMNLFDRSYESIRSIAMPGRSIMLNLVVSYNKKEKKG